MATCNVNHDPDPEMSSGPAGSTAAARCTTAPPTGATAAAPPPAAPQPAPDTGEPAVPATAEGDEASASPVAAALHSALAGIVDKPSLYLVRAAQATT